MPKPRPPRRDPAQLADLRAGLYCRVSKAARTDDDGSSSITRDEKSVDQQEAEGNRWADRHGVNVVEVYREPHRSASKYTTRKREQFSRLRADIRAGKLDLIWFWEQSRSTRQLDVFAELRNDCRDHGVLWVIRDKVLDPASRSDMVTAGIFAIMDEDESARTSERILRDKQYLAEQGHPPGRIPYGYKRIWAMDGAGKKRWVQDVPDVYDGDGPDLLENSPAWVVAEAFRRIAAGESVRAIRNDLNARGVRTKRGYHWQDAQINYIAQNPTYIAKRFHQANDGVSSYIGRRRQVILEDVEVKWPALVDEATFWAVQQRYEEQARTHRRPKRARHLLSGVARCAKCGAYLSGHNPRGRQSGPVYMCQGRACVGIYEHALDPYVETLVVRWLTDKAPHLLQQGNDTETAARARQEAEQFRNELAVLYQDAEAGDVSPTIATRRERRLLEAIAAADERAKAAALPSVLVGVIGPQAAAKWVALDLSIRRQIIKAVADIRIRPVGRGPNRIPVKERVEWRWLLGPGSEGAEE